MGQLMKLFQQFNKKTDSNDSVINLIEKLNHYNYTRWARLMYLAIDGKDKDEHLIALPPAKENLEYKKWAWYDSLVILWIIENIEAD